MYECNNLPWRGPGKLSFSKTAVGVVPTIICKSTYVIQNNIFLVKKLIKMF